MVPAPVWTDFMAFPKGGPNEPGGPRPRSTSSSLVTGSGQTGVDGVGEMWV